MACLCHGQGEAICAAYVDDLVDLLVSSGVHTKDKVFNQSWNEDIIHGSILDPEFAALVASESV